MTTEKSIPRSRPPVTLIRQLWNGQDVDTEVHERATCEHPHCTIALTFFNPVHLPRKPDGTVTVNLDYFTAGVLIDRLRRFRDHINRHPRG